MRLFVYGVLIRKLARGRAAELAQALGDGLPATTRGALYALGSEQSGWYPALVADPDGESVHGPVHGIVHEAGTADWAAMDAFENAHDGAGAEYRRVSVPVILPNAFTVEAQAYVLASSPPEAAERIAHGDFGRWLAETGREPFG